MSLTLARHEEKVRRSHGATGRIAMTRNVGGIDRILRIVVGVGLIGATVAGYLPVWGWIGVVPLATGLIGVCPAYLPLGFKTCKE
jgi:hypothetical protein